MSTIGLRRLRTRSASARSRSSVFLGIVSRLSGDRSQNSAVTSVLSVKRLFSMDTALETITRFSRASISCSRRSVTVLPAPTTPHSATRSLS